MNTTILTRDGARVMGISAVVLAATLAALLAIFALAKPSGAQAQTVTLEPAELGFGGVTVSGDPERRTVTITNNGPTALKIGGVSFRGLSGLTLDPGTFTTSIDPTRGLRVGAGDTATFQVSFDPATTGFKEAVGTLTDVSGVTISGAPQITVSGTGVTTQPAATNNCDIIGTKRGETLTGTSRGEVICALGGADRVKGRGGSDKILGGSGNDRLVANKGKKDRLIGQNGRDVLNAKDRRRGDLLVGGPHRDRAIKDRGDRVRSI